MIQVPALIVIGLWIVLQFFSGIGSIANTAQTGGVAYLAHIGGFVAGLVLTFVLRGKSTPRLWLVRCAARKRREPHERNP